MKIRLPGGGKTSLLFLFPFQELPIKVQQVLGLYIPSSSEEDSPDSQTSETQRLLAQSQAEAASCSSASGPTYP